MADGLHSLVDLWLGILCIIWHAYFAITGIAALRARKKVVHKRTKHPTPINNDPARLAWIIAKSGECFIGFSGGITFAGFRSASAAAWWLRTQADAIEREGTGKTGERA